MAAHNSPKYESNQIPQQDVIKVQVELSKIIEKIFLLRQNRSSTVVKLNSLLNRSFDSKIEEALTVDEVEFKYRSLSIRRKKLNGAPMRLIERSSYDNYLLNKAIESTKTVMNVQV